MALLTQPKSITFNVDGRIRTASYEGDTTQPTGLRLWLDGGEQAQGRVFLRERVDGVTNMLDVGPDGLSHPDGRSVWIKSFVPNELFPGVERDDDLRMVAVLRDLMKQKQPTIKKAILGGHSGGAGMTLEYLAHGAGGFDGYVPSKRPLHLEQTDGHGKALLVEKKPTLYLWGELDPTGASPEEPGYLTFAETATALVAAFGSVKTGQFTSVLDGHTLVREDYGPLLSIVKELRGYHGVPVGWSGYVQAWMREHGALP